MDAQRKKGQVVMGCTEIPMFFEQPLAEAPQRLFGILHQPVDHTQSSGWVFCHPFAEEKLWSHRIYVDFARRMAELGYPILRFDYRGYGDSDGDFESSTLNDQLDDIKTAIEKLSHEYPSLDSIGLFGLRYGASLAMLAAEHDRRVDQLILWDPLPSLEDYLVDQLRSNLTTQMVLHGKVVTNRDGLIAGIRRGEVVNIDGYGLCNPFFDAACAADLGAAADSYEGKSLTVEITRSVNSAPKNELIQMAERLCKNSMARVQEVQFWKEIKPFVKRSAELNRVSLEWLEQESTP